MSVKITRCPQCQTSFKVSAEHLAIAAGAVRCGSCLHVFQALEHLVPQAPLASVEPPAAIVTAAATAAAVNSAASEAASEAPTNKKYVEIDDDALISDDMDFDDDEDEQPAPAVSDSTFASGLILGDDIPEQVFHVPDELNVELTEQEDWQRALAAGSGEHAEATGDRDDYSDLFDDGDWGDDNDHNAEDLSLAEMNIEAEASAPATAVTQAASPATDLSELDDFDSDQLLAELQATIADLGETQQQTAAAVAEFTGEAASASTIPSGNLRFGSESEQGDDEIQFTASHNSERLQAADHSELDFDDELQSDAELEQHHTMRDIAVEDLGLNPDELPPVTVQKPLIDQIEPLPVDIGRFEREPTDWLALVKGFAACAALCAVFFAQFVFFNFHDLAHDLSARSWLGKICQTGICQLPALDPARVVKISNLIVRNHPDQPNALAVDAILLNTESEPVPVPELELLFSTMEKLPLASRRFKPAEFLAGELAGQTELPPGRPIHVALAIVEPGPDAVNWTLAVKRAAE